MVKGSVQRAEVSNFPERLPAAAGPSTPLPGVFLKGLPTESPLKGLLMIVTGLLQPTGNAAPNTLTTAGGTPLAPGSILTARVGELGEGGRGTFQLPDGSRLTFMGARGLTVGEQVRLQVVSTVPEPAVRIVGSESQVAATLARGAQAALRSGPEVFTRLLSLATPGGTRTPGAPSTPTPAAPTPAPPTPAAAPPAPTGPLTPGMVATAPTAAPTLAPTGLQATPAPATALGLATPSPPDPATRPALSPLAPDALFSAKIDGRPLSHFLAENLPNVSLRELARGEPEQFSRLFGMQTGDDLAATVRRFRLAADGMVVEVTRNPSPAAQAAAAMETEGARAAMDKLSDLVAMQELLPKNPLPDGAYLLGYRLFWLTEEGLGEAIWRREPKRGGETGEEAATSVMLNLTLTGLGTVQARLFLREGSLSIGISAREEGSISALRREIGDLRTRLLTAGLPLRDLDIYRLSGEKMRDLRQEALGLAAGFAAEA